VRRCASACRAGRPQASPSTLRTPYLGPAAGHSSGQGLQGVAERVELLGGHLAYGLDDGGATFRVTVTLPWRC